MSEAKQEDIQLLLQDVAQRYGIAILHAVEGGSRAWGFSSSNCNYNIRFIYAHNYRHYLTAFDKKDQLALASYGNLDAVGWDLTKCLRLLYRGNVTVHEWLASRIVYQSSPQISYLRRLAASVFNPAPAFFHYLSGAKKKLLADAATINYKIFLTGLYNVLCARWIADEQKPSPMDLVALSHRYIPVALQEPWQTLLQKTTSSAEQETLVVERDLLNWARREYKQCLTAQVPNLFRGDIAEYDEAMWRVLWQKPE